MGLMHVIPNSEPLEDVDCFKYLRSQVAVDGGCVKNVVQRMNEEYRAVVGTITENLIAITDKSITKSRIAITDKR